MTGRRLPNVIEPLPFAARGVALDGVIALDEFPRLRELVRPSSDAEVQARLVFARDTDGRATVSGQLEAQVELRCDRCLADVGHQLVAAVNMCVVRDDAQAAALLGECDPFVLEEPRISPAQLLEDDLLLSLPLVACPDLDNCPRRPALQYGGDENDKGTAETANPFAVLATLKSPQS